MGYEQQIDQVHSLSRYLVQRLKQSPEEFEIVLEEVRMAMMTLFMNLMKQNNNFCIFFVSGAWFLLVGRRNLGYIFACSSF